METPATTTESFPTTPSSDQQHEEENSDSGIIEIADNETQNVQPNNNNNNSIDFGDDWTVITGVSSEVSEEEATEEMQRRRRRKHRQRRIQECTVFFRSYSCFTSIVLLVIIAIGLPLAYIGSNQSGQIADRFQSALRYEIVEEGTALSSIVADSGHTCAIRATDGSVFCWSAQIGVPPSLPPAIQVAVGDGFSCALHETAPEATILGDSPGNGTLEDLTMDRGVVTCWGGDFQADFAQPPADLGEVSDLVASGEVVCAVQAYSKGGICWGFFDYGRDVIRLPDETAISKIYLPKASASLEKVCAILEDDDDGQSIHCWGVTSGLDLVENALFVPETLGPVISFAMMDDFACAIPEATEILTCWNYSGVGGPFISAELESMPLLGVYAGVENSFCVIDLFHNPTCCNKAGRPIAIPSQVGELSTITMGQNHMCGLQDRTNLGICWSFYSLPGQLAPLKSLSPLLATSVGTGDRRSCATLKGQARVDCWGEFDFQLRVIASTVVVGDEVTCVIDMLDSLAKCVIGDRTFILDGQVKQLAVNQNDMICSIGKDTPAVQCYIVGCEEAPTTFGRQQWHCFGTSNFMGSPEMQLSEFSAETLYLGERHYCAISSIDSKLGCWEDFTSKSNDEETSSTDFRSSPQASVPSDLGPVVDVALGLFFTCAVEVGGRVVCWGDQDKYAVDYVLEGIPTHKTYQAIEASNFEVCAVSKEDLSVDCWGRPFISASYVPDSVTNVQQLSGGNDHFCAIVSTDEMVCWGSNNYGELSPDYGRW